MLSSSSSFAQIAVTSTVVDSQAAQSFEQITDSYAAEDTAEADGLSWNLIIPIMVLVVCGSVIFLCYQAILAWSGYWKTMALAPLLVLVVWSVVILIAKISDPTSHEIWPFEVFSWAMFTTIYLVVLMTAKRTFDKTENQKNT